MKLPRRSSNVIANEVLKNIKLLGTCRQQTSPNHQKTVQNLQPTKLPEEVHRTYKPGKGISLTAIIHPSKTIVCMKTILDQTNIGKGQGLLQESATIKVYLQISSIEAALFPVRQWDRRLIPQFPINNLINTQTIPLHMETTA